jgi:hypothetical protein
MAGIFDEIKNSCGQVVAAAADVSVDDDGVTRLADLVRWFYYFF